MQCRICLEEGDQRTLLSPCACRGTASYIHRDCLDRYIQYYPDRICRVCHSAFDYESQRDISLYWFLFGVFACMLFFSDTLIIVKLSLLTLVAILSLYLLRLNLIESTSLTFLAILALIFFPGGNRNGMQMILLVLGIIGFVYTLSRQMPMVVLLGLVVTTMTAVYSAFFLFLAFHALDPPAFTVLLCAYFMAWYGWVHTRLRIV